GRLLEKQLQEEIRKNNQNIGILWLFLRGRFVPMQMRKVFCFQAHRFGNKGFRPIQGDEILRMSELM
ncbi:hypothetical protein, partial [Paenibacillus germinis]|uniref:hypothetical protein n=1 Tax=Paenibacillus germinis TaxID=2654979 RepID=UPI001C108A29